MSGDYLIDQICGPYLQAYQATTVIPGPDEDPDTFDMEKDVLDYLRRKNVTEEEVLGRVSHLIRRRVEHEAINYVVLLVDHVRQVVVLIFVMA